MTFNNLEEFKNIDLENINCDTLTDLASIKINKEDDKIDKILNFLKDVKNPYIFKHGDIIVKCSFSDSGSRIEEHIERYLTHFLQE